ncbi:MAG: GNAT family N-acetyltransferase [Acidimicrobiales bacterium]
MVTIRRLRPDDARGVVDRIVAKLDDDARRNSLVNPSVDEGVLLDTMRHATNATWVALDDDKIVGHLYGAVLGDHAQSRAAWTGPDGVSFDDGVLDQLLTAGVEQWRREHATHHYSWTLLDHESIETWLALGYETISVRGVMELGPRRPRALPAGTVLRVARATDVNRALELDRVIDLAQEGSPHATRKDRRATRRELLELLEDPEVHHYVVESDGLVLAQAITFPLPTRRGSFDATLHLSEVVVDPREQGRGIASAMIDAVLDRARLDGSTHVEVQWRVSNDQAANFWTRYGFTPTYARLGRELGSGK